MEMDFVQIVPHVFRSSQAKTYPPLQGSRSERNGFFIELSRYDEARIPVRVAYRCDDKVLNFSLEPINVRPSVAGSPAPSAPVHPLLNNVEQCEVAYLGADNAWLAAWSEKQAGLKPKAIRIRLTLGGRGQFERLYYLP